MNDKYFVSKMKNVLQISIEGKDLNDPKEYMIIDRQVETKVKAIIDKLKVSHEKFIDEDFGPTSDDEYGALSLYGSIAPNSSGGKYPAPESIKWVRPVYDDDKFAHTETQEDVDEIDEEDEYGFSSHEDSSNDTICDHGKLFLDGSSSGDVIQGQLGDCWFLGALAVMGAHESLLNACFWRGDSFKEHGLYVIRFFKDCNIFFIIIDDRLPAKQKDSRLIFASCKDPNELWVPYMEKAYAKLHGSYKALIGGYSHYALGDMTGFCPRLVVLKPGFTGYCEEYTEDQVWSLLKRYKSWNCLMGCSIQSNPKDNQKVEAEAGLGLYYGHAYSLLDLNEIDIKPEDSAKGLDSRLVKVRNPWGRGEWEGAFSDKSSEREDYDKEISKKFNHDREISEIADDGTFFMPFREWFHRFTSLFSAVRFPPSWKGQRCNGAWSGDVGGNRQMGTWLSNPKIKLRLNSKPKNGNSKSTIKSGDLREVFIGIYIRDSRMTLGFDYYKDPLYATPLAFDVVTEKELKCADPSCRSRVSDAQYPNYLNSANETVKQPPYNFGTTQLELKLKVDEDYYIVPSLYKRNQPGTFFITVFADVDDFFMEGGVSVASEHEPMTVGGNGNRLPNIPSNNSSPSRPNAPARSIVSSSSMPTLPSAPIISVVKELKMSKAQFYEKKESLRDRIISESKRLNLNVQTISSIFSGQSDLPIPLFKRRMLDLGFNLADFPDDDLVVLDEDNSGAISREELVSFLKAGIVFSEGTDVPEPPPPPEDDLLFKASDMEGIISLNVISGRRIRDANNWFNIKKDDNNSLLPSARKLIKYDAVAAMNARTKQLTLSKESKLDAQKNQLPTISEIDDNGVLDDLNHLMMSPSRPVKGGDKPSIISNSINSHNLKSLQGGHVDTNREDDLKSVVTKFTINPLETAKHGAEAGIKLHTDSSLQKAEFVRTSNFLALKRAKQNISASKVASELELEAVLHLKTKNTLKREKRNILKDLETMRWLSYSMPEPDIKVRQPRGQSGNLSNKLSITVDSETSMKNMTPKATSLISGDIWDSIIENVVSISSSRSKLATVKTQAIHELSQKRIKSPIEFDIFNVPESITPQSTKNLNIKRGNAPTPKNQRKTPGTASVVSYQSLSKQKEAVLDSKMKLQVLEQEQKDCYEEVYRRLVLVPICSPYALEGNRAHDVTQSSVTDNEYILKLFKSFDRDGNGTISFEEFQIAAKSLKVDMSTEDCKLLFSRLDSKNIDNSIDVEEFTLFFNNCIKPVAPSDSSKNNRVRSMEQILIYLKSRLLLLMNPKNGEDVKESSDQNKATTQSNPISSMFNSLNSSSVTGNVDKFKKLGIDITVEEMSRVSRVFNESICSFMEFMLNKSTSLSEALLWTDSRIIRCLIERSGSSANVSSSFSSANAEKIWKIIRSQDGCVKFDSIALYFLGLVEDSIHSHEEGLIFDETNENRNHCEYEVSGQQLTSIGGSFVVSPREIRSLQSFATTINDSTKPRPSSLSSQKKSKSKDFCSIMGVNLNILCRIIIDNMCSSPWNRQISQTLPTGSSVSYDNLSFSGFQAYVRASHVLELERKLRYMMHVAIDSSSNSTFLLIHVYIHSKRNDAIILAYEPIKGEVYKLAWKEDLTNLPIGDAVRELMQAKQKQILGTLKSLGEINANLFNPASCYLYNPIDTPFEDKAISDMVERLRLVRTCSCDSIRVTNPNQTSSYIMFAEDPKFIDELKKLLNSISNDVPFFSVLNDVTLTFEVDETALQNSGSNKPLSLEKIVFGSIRKQKTLLKFLTSVSSSMSVVLSTYNGGRRITMKWVDMANYLMDYRNPFVTVQLLPKYLEPSDYFYIPSTENTAFSGEEESNSNSDSHILQKGDADYDGGKFPVWNSRFKMLFKPPKLTSCKILSKETAKLKIEGKLKFVMIMVRLGIMPRLHDNENGSMFLFLTVYDPRTSTEYQCGVSEKCKLFKTLTTFSSDSKLCVDSSLSALLPVISDDLEDAIVNQYIILGPAITPRLLVNVYNQRGKEEELLGSCQVSISSALSGSGTVKPQWVTLNYAVNDFESQGTVNQDAGEVLLDISFRKLVEIEAEKRAAEERFEKLKIKTKDVRKMSVSGLIPIIPDQTVNVEQNTNNEKPKIGKGDVDAVSKVKAELEEKSKLIAENKKEIERLKVENDQLKKSAQLSIVNSSQQTSKVLEKNAPIQNKTTEEKQIIVDTTAVLAAEKKAKDLEDLANKLNEEKIASEKDKQKLANDLLKKQEIIEKHEKSLKEASEIRLENSKLQAELKNMTEINRQLSTPKDLTGVSQKSVSVVEHKPDLEATAISSDFNGMLSYVLDTFTSRYEKRIEMGTAIGGPLGAFERLLKAHSEENLVNARQIFNAFSDASIDITLEFAETLLHRVGKPLSSTRDYITYNSLVTFLTRRFANLNEISSPVSTMNSPNSNSTLKPKSKPTLKTETKKLKDQVVDESSRKITENPLVSDTAEKSSLFSDNNSLDRSSKSQSLSNVSSIDMPDKTTQKHNQKTKGSIAKVNDFAATEPLPSAASHERDDTQSKTLRHEVRNSLDLDRTDKSLKNTSILNTSNDASINWDEAPLPSNVWERKIDHRTNRIYYVNHETKTTQWRHPLYKSLVSEVQSTKKKEISSTVRVPIAHASDQNQARDHEEDDEAVSVTEKSASVRNKIADDSKEKNISTVRKAWS